MDPLTPAEIAALVVERVDDIDEAATWVAVILAESGGDPVAYNLVDHNPESVAYLSLDLGLFQINTYWHGSRITVEQSHRPADAWEYAWELAGGDRHPPDWSPWVAYLNGAYLGEQIIEFDVGHVVEQARLDTAYQAVLDTTEQDTSMPRYPYGYGTGTMTMAQLRGRYEPKMHPEFARRLFAWLESEGGTIGIGGGWRDTQPDRPGFAPDGKSFHQSQTFASGIVAYAAVDLVVKRAAGVHRSPTWPETDSARAFGLHTFIQDPPEPWHMQPLDGPARGWQTWVNAGRPDPDPSWSLPTDPDPTPPPTPNPAEEIMFRYRHTGFADQFAVGSSAIHMTPTALGLAAYAALDLVENDDRAFLVHCCQSSGFDFADLTPM